MSNLQTLQDYLGTLGQDGVVIASADEYLSEFAPPCSRRLQWATGFKGSMGAAVVLKDRAALFVDGRYVEQAGRDTAGTAIEIVQGGYSAQCTWLRSNVPCGRSLVLDGRLHPYTELKQLRVFAEEHGIELAVLSRHPIDDVWRLQRPSPLSSIVHDYPEEFAGAAWYDKCQRIAQRLAESGVHAHLVADPEDVAWLLNIRTNDCESTTPEMNHVVPIPLSRIVVDRQGKVTWFIERQRVGNLLAQRPVGIEVLHPDSLEKYLFECSAGRVLSANLRRTPYLYATIVEKNGTLRHDASLSEWRWCKHEREIKAARHAHFQDGLAVVRFLAWLKGSISARTISEMDASYKLHEFRQQLPTYKGMSMPYMSASGTNSALAHYSPSRNSNSILNDHPIYWMDSGGHFPGCSTDNTVCIAVRPPDECHIRAHTLVLKGFIALACAKFPANISSTQIDTLARQYLWQEGLDYAHGTGHGVGNFMNIHEGPAIRKDSTFPTVAPMQSNMIVANEPAVYFPANFGVRIECHMLTVPARQPGFLEFEVLSRLPIDPDLVDFASLTSSEKQWLARYHDDVLQGYSGHLDGPTQSWLNRVAEAYRAANQLG